MYIRPSTYATILLLVFSTPSSAKTWTVPSEIPKIQTAINSASDGDTIVVEPGMYTERLRISDKGLVLIGIAGPENTILSGLGAPPGIWGSLLEFGGPGDTTLITGFTFEDAGAARTGGAIYCPDHRLTLQNNIFRRNFASWGGAVFVRWDGHLVCLENRFENNTSLYGGGGITLWAGATGDITRNTFSNNAAIGTAPIGSGGALQLDGAGQGTTISENEFIRNEAGYGAISIFRSNNISLDHNTIVFNRSTRIEVHRAAGIRIRDSSVLLENNIIALNKNGWAISLSLGATVSLECNNIWKNDLGSYFILFDDGKFSGATDFSTDPLFCDAEAGNLTLASNSPCLPENSCGCGLVGALGQACSAMATTTWSVPCPIPTIQAAIDSASDGDTVWVSPGTYSGLGNRNLNFGGKNLALISTAGLEFTIIDCDQEARAFLFQSGEDSSSVVDGFTILSGNGGGTQPGGVRGDGGAVYISGASPVIRNCNFRSNVGGKGGAIFVDVGSALTLDNCRLTGNQTSVHSGGAIFAYESLTMTDCTVDSNTSVAQGGGIFSGDLTLLRCDITDNRADHRGGGVEFQGVGLIEDCRILRNHGWGGGGISAIGVRPEDVGVRVPPLIRNSLISGNTSDGSGGGVSTVFLVDLKSCTVSENVCVGNGGGVDSNRGGRFEDCTFTENTAGNAGGGIYLSGGGFTGVGSIAKGCTVSGNTADTGGGIAMAAHLCGDSPLAIGCTITGNRSDRGGGVAVVDYRCGTSSQPSLTLCTISGNHSDFGGAFYAEPGVSAEFRYSILWANCADSTGGSVFLADSASVTFLCSNVDSTKIAGPGTAVYDGPQVVLNPLFCAPAPCSVAPTVAGDYTLAANSPCLPFASPCDSLIGALGQGCQAPLVPVRLVTFTVGWIGDQASLRWEVGEATNHSGFYVYRGSNASNREQITHQILVGMSPFEFKDSTPPKEGADYWLAEISRTGETTWHGPVSLPPFQGFTRLVLGPNYPNPFTAQTNLTFQLPSPGRVILSIFDLAGREVARLMDGELPAGEHQANWDGKDQLGRDLPAGVYLMRLETDEGVRSRKIVKVE